jgi:hypothetical protein
MSIDLGDAFGAYSREELQETLRSMDPKKDPENYAAIKAALSRALPEGVAGSCLDIAALSKLEVTIQSTNGSKVWAVVVAVLGTFILTRRFLDHPVKDLTVYWVGALTLIALALFLWIVAARRTVTAYRFSNGMMECTRAGEITWQQSLSDLVRVEEVEGGRYEEPSLKFHWPTNTRQVDLEVADFAKFGVVPKDQT